MVFSYWRIVSKRIRFSLFAIFFVATPLAAWAQVDSGQIERRFETTPTPRAQPGPLIPEFDGLTAPDAATALKFTLQNVEVQGSTVYSEEALRPLYDDLIGTEVSVADIYAIANRITEKYGADGYTLSRAIVPEQRIDEDGVIRIQVLEGYIEDIEIDGDVEDQRGFFDHYKDQILSKRPIRTQTLERYLLLAGDLPGFDVTSVLRRSQDATGGAILILEVEQDALAGELSVDNRGTKEVGRYQYGVLGAANNPLGLYDRTQIRYVNASLNDELHYAEIVETLLLHPEGTSLEFGARYTTSEPGTEPLESIELETESLTAFVEIRHPFVRSRQTNLDAYGQFELRESETLAFDSTLNEDSIRSLRAGVEFDHADQYRGINQAIVEFSQGVPVFGASDNDDPDNSRLEGRVDYSKLNFYLSRTQGLGYFSPDLSIFAIHLAARGQWAANPLLSSEECGLGGSDFGRAYDPSAILGDHCLAGSFEIRFQPQTEGPLDYMQFYAFADGGQVWNRDDNADPDSRDFVSIGAGVRFGFLDIFRGSLEAGLPMTDNIGATDKHDPRLFFTIKGEF